MYPHRVFDLEPAGTFGMYPICYWWVSGRYFQPEPAMYSRYFHWFPGPLAPSDSTSQKLERQRCSNDSWGGWVLTSCLQLLQPHREVLRLCCHQGPLTAPVVNSLIMMNPIHSPTLKMLYLLPKANLQERRICPAQAQVASIDNASKSQAYPS